MGGIAISKTEIRLGDRADFVDIRAEEGMLMIEVVGAPDSGQIFRGMQEGYARGWISTRMPTLVDVSAFQGGIDWIAIKALSQMARWGDGKKPPRVAYVSRDPLFTLVVKAISAMFPLSTHCMFPTRQAALTWLGSDG